MPFDSTQQDKLTMADLAWRLRNPETWPPGFKWNYAVCDTCAMGLAWQLSGGKEGAFKDMKPDHAASLTVALLADAAAKDSKPFADIFLRLRGRNIRPPFSMIQPTDVADAIDDYLATRVPA